ncbi:hypothetical protein HPB48_004863 [Haemaphysalis longicornis]|uniref:Uncharacterized protein n=1 Tax=Haemaphysalis longicornis TaxID=44386 RepID=A0A9J6GR06_HAELO|nr:hypothetical protein HPB48_004863 [Haemaphysalis longicornis]
MWVTSVTYAKTLTCASAPSVTNAIRATITNAFRNANCVAWNAQRQANSVERTSGLLHPLYECVNDLPNSYPPVLDSQAMITALREKNAHLRQLLTAQAERTANLEKRLAELLSQTASTPPTTPPPADPSSANPTPPLNPFTSPDITRLESLIRDISKALSERIAALESQSDLPASPEPKRRIPRKHQEPSASSTVMDESDDEPLFPEHPLQ